MEYMKQFKEHYAEWFKGMSAKQLVQYEQNLSKYIDSDLFQDSLLADEVIELFEMVRDECVYRVSKLAETDWTNV